MDPETGRIEDGGTVAALDMERAKTAVVEELTREGEPMTEPEVRETVGGNTGLTGKALRELVAIGQVERTGAGKRGSPYRFSFLVSAIGANEENEKNGRAVPATGPHASLAEEKAALAWGEV